MNLPRKALVYACWLFTAPLLPAADAAFLQLHEAAVSEITCDTNYVGRIRIRGDPLLRRLILDNTPLVSRGEEMQGNVLERAYEAYVRHAVLSRDARHLPPAFRPLAELLDRYEKEAVALLKELVALESDPAAARTSAKRYQAQMDQRFAAIQNVAARIAHRNDWSLATVKGAATPFRVTVKIEPEEVRIRYMSVLRYKKAVAIDQGPRATDWTILHPGQHRMIGRYIYEAAWPRHLGGMETNVFLIDSDCEFSIRPSAKDSP